MSYAKLYILSIIGGAVITVALTWTAFSIDNQKAAHVLLWQDTILLYLVGPAPDAQGNPGQEGRPLQTVILPVGFLLSIPIYSAVCYLVLRVSFGLRADGLPNSG